MKETKHNLMACRGIAAFLVVLEHSIIRYPIDLRAQAEWCVILGNLINSFHMPLFFLLSGYFTSTKGLGSPQEWLAKHAKRLLLPYLVMGMVDMMPRLLLQSLVNNPSNIQDSLIDIIFYGGYFWFLIAMFLVQLVAAVGVSCGQRKLLFGISVVLMISTRLVSFPDLFCINQAAYYLFFYLLGGYYREFEEWAARKQVLLNIVSALVFVLFGWMGNHWANILVAIAASWLTLQLATQLTRKGKNAVLEAAGKYSLQIYLFNGITLGVARTLLVRIGVTSPLILIVGNTALVLLAETIGIFILKQLPGIPVLFGMQTERRRKTGYAAD